MSRLLVSLCFLFVVVSFFPTLYEIREQYRMRPERYFELVHNFPTDYNFYLSRIRQGIEGRTSVIEQYTSEPHQGSYIQVFYLFLGWLGRWSRVPWERGGDVYHVARFVFGMTLILLIAEYCKRSFEIRDSTKTKNTFLSSLLDTRYSILAFLLAVTASTWPKPVSVAGAWRFGGYMPWWSVMDSLQRITFIPHLLVGQALTLFLIMALADEDTMKKPGNWVFLGILAFALGIIFPPGLLFVIAAVALLQLFEVLLMVKGDNNFSAAKLLPLKSLIPRAVVLGLGLPSLIYLSLMTSFYPWKRLAEFDIVKPLPFNYGEYLLAVGPILPIGLLGLVVVLITRERRMLPSVAWVLAWAALLFVFQFIPAQSPLRFSEMIPHVPLGVLTTYLFFWLYGLVSSHNNQRYVEKGLGISIKYLGIGKKFISLILNTTPLLLVFLGFGVMYSSALWQKDFIDTKLIAAYPLVPTGGYVMYPLKDFIAAMKYLQDATPRDTVILSETTAGNYIPVQSGNTVYVGHANTVNAEEKELVVRQFFSGRMKPDVAHSFLSRENLHWVFFGPQEREDGGISDLAKIYPFLTEAYRNSFVAVYQMK